MIVPHWVLGHVRWCERVAGHADKMRRMDHFLLVCGFVYLYVPVEPLVTMKADQNAVAGEIQNGLCHLWRLAKPGNSGHGGEAGM
jgi:hypothetical protein